MFTKLIFFLFGFKFILKIDRIATSLTPNAVQEAMNSAEPGDRVILPPGTEAWTSSVTWIIPANVTLVGAGSLITGGGDQTVIIDNYASSSPLINFSISSSGTFRITGITIQSGTGSQKDGGTILINGPGNLRIDHSHFNITSTNNYKVIVFLNGIRGVMYNCILDFVNLCALYFRNGRFGENEDTGNYEWTQPTAFGSSDYFFIEDNIVNGSTTGTSYSTRLFDSYSGGKVVVRFNTLVSTTLGDDHATGHSADDRGPRAKEIYGNSVTSNGTFDGTLANPAPNFGMVDLASGTALIWGNSADWVYKHMFLLKVTRKDTGTYLQSPTPNGWGYAGPAPIATGTVSVSGTSVTWVSGDTFNTNWPSGTMIYISGGNAVSVSSITRSSNTATVTTSSAHGYATGDLVIISGATGGDATYYNVSGSSITVTGPNTFTYSMWGTPSGSATGTITASLSMKAEAVAGQEWPDGPTGAISSVGSTTSITLANGGHSGTNLTGATYTVGSTWDGNATGYLGYPAIDQPGRGQGDLLTGVFPNKVNATTNTIAWPNQALEPIYIWNNAGSIVTSWGGPYVSDQSGGRVVANRDYYPAASGVQTNATTPFDGTSGTGWGTLANRPTTCTAGVAYWATDQGDWNQSTSNPYGVQQNGANGVLYVATATNTWTLYYEPYTYPHPLRNESSNSTQSNVSFRVRRPNRVSKSIRISGRR